MNANDVKNMLGMGEDVATGEQEQRKPRVKPKFTGKGNARTRNSFWYLSTEDEDLVNVTAEDHNEALGIESIEWSTEDNENIDFILARSFVRFGDKMANISMRIDIRWGNAEHEGVPNLFLGLPGSYQGKDGKNYEKVYLPKAVKAQILRCIHKGLAAS